MSVAILLIFAIVKTGLTANGGKERHVNTSKQFGLIHLKDLRRFMFALEDQKVVKKILPIVQFINVQNNLQMVEQERRLLCSTQLLL